MNKITLQTVSAAITAVENDSKLKSELQQAAKIQEMSRKAAGFGNMVSSKVDKFTAMATYMVKNLTSGNNTINESDIERIVEKKIEH